MKAVFTKVNKYHVDAECIAPVHVGCGEGQKGGILIHPVSGKPFIQGTSIAGIFSDYVKSKGMEAGKWFGFSSEEKKTDGRSKVTFSDAVFEEKSVMLETRPHVRIDPVTSSVSSGETLGTSGVSGHKLDITYVAEGSRLRFDIYQFMDADEDSEEIIEECLSALNRADIRIGGRTTTGCGIVKVISAMKTSYDMRDEKDREQWADESKTSGEPVDLDKYESASRFIKIKIDVGAEKLAVKGSYIDNSVLDINGYNTEKEKAPDSMPASNAARKFFVPGSSFKGVFRSHISSVSGYIGMSEIFMEKAFSEKTKSKIYFRDSVFNDDDVNIHVVSRNKIDKFTGGTIDKSLFREVEISGKFTVNIDIDTRESEIWTANDIKRSAALLILSARDLAVHSFTIGSGASVGRGYTDVKYMSIDVPGEKTYTIDFANSSMDAETEGFVSECLGLLKEEN